MLPSQLMPVFDGAVPCVIVTSTADGIPNITNLSRVWFMDSEHVAAANQLLNKTECNLIANPLAVIKIANPKDYVHWELTVRFVRSEQTGALFETLRRDLHTVSWMAGYSGSVNLRSAMIFRVLNVRKCLEESQHAAPTPELFGDLLKVLAAEFELNRSSYWIANEEYDNLRLLASRGVPGAGTDKSAFEPMKRLAGLVAAERRIIQLRNIRSQMKYVHNIHAEEDRHLQGPAPDHPHPPLPASFFAFPVLAFDSLVGIVCCEETEAHADTFNRLDDDYMMLLSRKLGEALASAAAAPENERELFFKQLIERTRLEWIKRKDPFHTVLSARERQVAEYAAKGYTNAELAKTLFVSTRTVTTHMERIFQKLQVTSRAALTRYIVEKGLLGSDRDEPSR